MRGFCLVVIHAVLVVRRPCGRVRRRPDRWGELHAASAAAAGPEHGRCRARSRRSRAPRPCCCPDGTAAAPQDAPPQVQAAVWAANTIQKLPVPLRRRPPVLHLAPRLRLLRHRLLRAQRRRAAQAPARLERASCATAPRGPGQWFTIYTNPGHAYVVIAGLRLDTSSAGAGGGKGPRWRAKGRPDGGLQGPPPARVLRRPSVRGQGRGARRGGRRPHVRGQRVERSPSRSVEAVARGRVCAVAPRGRSSSSRLGSERPGTAPRAGRRSVDGDHRRGRRCSCGATAPIAGRSASTRTPISIDGPPRPR